MTCKATNDGNGFVHCSKCQHTEHEFFFSCQNKYRQYMATIAYCLTILLAFSLAWYVFYRI